MKEGSGSRFLYEPFDCNHAHKIELNERVAQERWAALEFRLGHIDAGLMRLEKRLWLTILGVAGVVLSETAKSVLMTAN